MITFKPLWNYIKKRGITTYQLIEEYDLNPAEISRLRHDHNFRLSSIDKLCKILNCQPCDLLEYIDNETDPNEK